MPGKRKTAPSTSRVRRHRLKNKIERLREGRQGKWDLVFWALQTYFVEHNLPLASFIRALDLHNAEVSDSNIKISVFISDEGRLALLNDHEIAGILQTLGHLHAADLKGFKRIPGEYCFRFNASAEKSHM